MSFGVDSSTAVTIGITSLVFSKGVEGCIIVLQLEMARTTWEKVLGVEYGRNEVVGPTGYLTISYATTKRPRLDPRQQAVEVGK